MKSKYFLFISILLILVTDAVRAVDRAQVNLELETATVLRNYSDNDLVQVTVAGKLSSTCYRMGPHRAQVDPESFTIYLQQTAYVHFEYCLMVVVPFTRVIELGPLRAGEYELKDAAAGKTLGHLAISRADGN